MRGHKMTARGTERVGPPMSRRNEEQYGNKNRMGREKERYLGVGETEGPRDSGGQIIASGTGQNPEHRAEKEPCSFLPQNAGVEFQFGIHIFLKKSLNYPFI